MKKYLLVSVMIFALFALVGFAYAQADMTNLGSSGVAIQGAGNTVTNTSANTFTGPANVGGVAPGGSVTVDPVNVNSQDQSQQQQQQQRQKAVSVSKSKSTANADSASFNAGNEQIITSPNIPLQAQPLYPYLLQMVPGMAGRVPETDVPEFYAIERLKIKEVWLNPATGEKRIVQHGDKVIDVEPFTRGGRWFGFSRIEDYDQDLLKLIPRVIKRFGQNDTTNIRYDVLFKTSQKSIGSGGGGGGSAAGLGGGANPVSWGSNAAVIPGVAINTFDPKITIKFYLIASQPARVEEKRVEKEVVIVQAAPQPPPPPPPPQVIVKEKLVVINLEDVHFRNDKWDLTKEAQDTLLRSVAILKDHPDTRVLIAGYASALASEKYNQRLSEKRAETVKSFLVQNGIPSGKLSVIGYGKTRLLQPEKNPKDIHSDAARANRTVIFNVQIN